MWPALVAAARIYAPWVMFPVTFVIGVVGYNLESLFDRSTPVREKSIQEEREERRLMEDAGKDVSSVPTLQGRSMFPKSNLYTYTDKPSSWWLLYIGEVSEGYVVCVCWSRGWWGRQFVSSILSCNLSVIIGDCEH